MTKHEKIIQLIQVCTDTAKLQTWIKNADREGAAEISNAARRKLVEVTAAKCVDDARDPMVLDFWKSITALEFALSEERGKTIRLSRTRQKIARVGVQRTLADLTLQTNPSDGYFLLRDRDMLDLSAEAVVLRFPNRFEDKVVQAARARLGADAPPAEL